MTVKHDRQKYSHADLECLSLRRDNEAMENLRRLRQARGLSQAQLADAAKCSQGLISKLESGGKNVTLHQIEAIAGVLRCEPWELFGIDQMRQRFLDAIANADPARRQAVLTLLGVDDQE